MFAGYGSFMLRDLPFDAIEFVAYEQLKKAWVQHKGSDIRPHESAVIGEPFTAITCYLTLLLLTITVRIVSFSPWGSITAPGDALEALFGSVKITAQHCSPSPWLGRNSGWSETAARPWLGPASF